MENLKDEHLSALFKAMPEPDTRRLNAEIMHAVRRRAARRRALRTIRNVSLGIVLAAVALALLVGVFALLATIGGLGDWLQAVDEYTVSGLLHLKMFCSSTTFQLLAAAAVTTVVVRIVIALLEHRRAKQNM